jgi:hypothetical protein
MYDDSQLLAFIAQYLPDNQDELITPVSLRYVLAQLVEAKVNTQVLATFAQLASPRFTGMPQVPTAPAGTNSDQVASTAFVQATLFGIASGKNLSELVLPQNVQAGYWYLNGNGIWEARRAFSAVADPVNGPNWLQKASFGGQMATLPVANLSDATAAGRAMLTAPSAGAQRGLVNNPQIMAGQYGNHPSFASEDGPAGSWAWVIKSILTLSSAKVVQLPEAPTDGQVDDTNDTFSFIANQAYLSFAQYKVNGLPGVVGPVYLDATNSYVQGNRIYVRVVGAVAKGGLAVYVAGSGNAPDGNVLTNTEPFTGPAVVTPTTPTGDTTNPNIAFIVPAAGATLTPNAQVLLTVSATDNVAVQGVVFTDGATGAPLGTGTKNGNRYTLAYTPTATGPLSLVATASDAAGNSESATVNVTVQAATTTPTGDTVKPDVSFTVPAAGATLTPGTQVVLTAIANDNVAVAGLTFTNGATGAVIGQGAKNGSLYTFPYTTGAAGALSLVATATDAAGNSQSATVNVTVQAATTTPSADLTAALAISLANLTLGSPLSYTVTPAGGTAPYAYEVVATDSLTGQQFTLGTGKTGNWTPTATGSYGIQATVTDSASPAKVAQSAIRYLQVVQAANRIPVADAGQDLTVPSTTTSVALMGKASDPDPDDTLTYLWRQVMGPDGAPAVTGLPATSLNVVASNLVVGTYQFGFRSTDNHGAQSVEDFVLLVVSPVVAGAGATTVNIGQPQLDGQGNRINGLMSSIVPDFGTGRTNKYWRMATNFGSGVVRFDTPLLGCLLYSSLDGINWTPEVGGNIPTPSGSIYHLMERPALVRLASGQWMLYAHTAPDPTPGGSYDSYGQSKVIMFRSKGNSPASGWDYLGVQNGMSGGCLDMSATYLRSTGKNYLISSVNNSYSGTASPTPWNVRIECCEISADGLSFGAPIVLDNRGMNGAPREAPQLFEHNGKLYLTTSPAVGYQGSEPSYKVGASLADLASQAGNGGQSLFLPSQGFASGLSKGTPFYGQASCVFEMYGLYDQNGYPALVMAADNWNIYDLGNSPYFYFPLHFDLQGNLYARRVEEIWKPSEAWTIAIPNNVVNSGNVPSIKVIAALSPQQPTDRNTFAFDFDLIAYDPATGQELVQANNLLVDLYVRNPDNAYPQVTILQGQSRSSQRNIVRAKLAASFDYFHQVIQNTGYLVGAPGSATFTVPALPTGTTAPPAGSTRFIEEDNGWAFVGNWQESVVPNFYSAGRMVFLTGSGSASRQFAGGTLNFHSAGYGGKRVAFDVYINNVKIGSVDYTTATDEPAKLRQPFYNQPAGTLEIRAIGVDVYLDAIELDA